jgi:LmbE family N-acetylglucosaminyl deacetylase
MTELANLGNLITLDGERAAPARVLVVCAHPDDVDFGAAGTVAALTAAGSHVFYCLVSSGEAGSDHLTIDARELALLREEEQTAAAKEVGVDDLTFLGHPDGAIEATIALRRDITATIRRTKPDVVITQSPERNLSRIFGSHPDHLAAGEATLCAVYPDARNPRSYPELISQGLHPHTVKEVWLMAHPSPDLRVDVTDTFDRKIAALRAHESQTAERDDLEDMIRGWLTVGAEAAGFAPGRLAESFKIVVTG